MTTPKTVDNFELAPLTRFEVGQTYKSTQYSRHHFELIEQSSSQKPSGFLDALANQVGHKVLIIGEGSTVRVVFGETVTNVTWVYYLDNLEDVLTVTTVLGENRETFNTGTLTPLQTVGLGDAEVDAIEIKATRAGSLHVDSLSWNKAGSGNT